jgi:hypothetical protein
VIPAAGGKELETTELPDQLDLVHDVTGNIFVVIVMEYNVEVLVQIAGKLLSQQTGEVA